MGLSRGGGGGERNLDMMDKESWVGWHGGLRGWWSAAVLGRQVMGVRNGVLAGGAGMCRPRKRVVKLGKSICVGWGVSHSLTAASSACGKTLLFEIVPDGGAEKVGRIVDGSNSGEMRK